MRAQFPAQPFIGFELVAVRLDAAQCRIVREMRPSVVASS
jgi:hypothetical protein